MGQLLHVALRIGPSETQVNYMVARFVSYHQIPKIPKFLPCKVGEEPYNEIRAQRSKRRSKRKKR